MNLSKFLRAGAMAAVAASMLSLAVGCCSDCNKVAVPDNADFYTEVNGKKTFDAKAAKAAYIDLCKKLGAPVYDRYLTEEGFLWAVDFAQGDFAKLGMGGLFWVNNRDKQYFAHEIFLLPGQSIAEHKHMPTVDDKGPLQAKHESWQVRYGSVYGFSEADKDHPANLDQFPQVKKQLSEMQVPHLNCVHVEYWEADGQVHPLLIGKKPNAETWHFMMGGPNGAVVSEYATYHDGNGLRFSCPNVAF